MMKSVARLSAGLALAAALCFAPCALAQGTIKNMPQVGYRSLNYTPASLLALTFGPPGSYGHGNNGGWSGGNGCSNQGNGDRGWDSQSWNGNGGSGCSTSVPEGGAAAIYLLLAGLSCFGVIFLRSQRRVSVSQAS
jgi:hypothetical protein